MERTEIMEELYYSFIDDVKDILMDSLLKTVSETSSNIESDKYALAYHRYSDKIEESNNLILSLLLIELYDSENVELNNRFRLLINGLGLNTKEKEEAFKLAFEKELISLVENECSKFENIWEMQEYLNTAMYMAEIIKNIKYFKNKDEIYL